MLAAQSSAVRPRAWPRPRPAAWRVRPCRTRRTPSWAVESAALLRARYREVQREPRSFRRRPSRRWSLWFAFVPFVPAALPARFCSLRTTGTLRLAVRAAGAWRAHETGPGFPGARGTVSPESAPMNYSPQRKLCALLLAAVLLASCARREADAPEPTPTPAPVTPPEPRAPEPPPPALVPPSPPPAEVVAEGDRGGGEYRASFIVRAVNREPASTQLCPKQWRRWSISLSGTSRAVAVLYDLATGDQWQYLTVEDGQSSEGAIYLPPAACYRIAVHNLGTTATAVISQWVPAAEPEPEPDPPPTPLMDPLPGRSATVTERFTACFDPQAVVALMRAYQALKREHGEEAAAHAVQDPEVLAEWECRWLEVGTRVQTIGNPVNAIVGEGQVIEGITIFVCEDRECRRTDMAGLVVGALWFPLAMLDRD